jgi:hypothetical protein
MPEQLSYLVERLRFGSARAFRCNMFPVSRKDLSEREFASRLDRLAFIYPVFYIARPRYRVSPIGKRLRERRLPDAPDLGTPARPAFYERRHFWCSLWCKFGAVRIDSARIDTISQLHQNCTISSRNPKEFPGATAKL